MGRFRLPANEAMDTILKERYTLRDASQRREPREFAQEILRASRDAGFTNVKNQLDVIYNGIDPELRRDVRRPKERTTLSDFLEDIEDLKHDWWTFASRHNSSRFASQQGPSSHNRPPQNQGNGQYQSQNHLRNSMPNIAKSCIWKHAETITSTQRLPKDNRHFFHPRGLF